VKKIEILTLSAATVHGCVPEADAEKSVLGAQDTTIGAMKIDRVQTIEKRFFAFSGTLNKCSAR
jgi:hypothetical protein